MSDGDSIAHVAVVVLLLSLAVPALATAHEFSGTPLSYEEQLTVDYTNESVVSQNATSEGYGATPTIVVNGAVLVEDTDFRWSESSGTVTWLNSANTTEGDTADIEYRAYQRTQESSMAWSIIAPLMSLFGLFGLVASVRALWSHTAEVWTLK